MITVVDIGNSFLKMGQWDGEQVSDVLRVRHRDLLDADWQAALEEGPEPSAQGVFVASVATEGVEQVFAAWLVSRGHKPPELLRVGAEAGGIRNAYRQPETLGVDRWCAMIAARSLHAGAFCVVDAGTAMTIDWVDAFGTHKGGLIMPGPNLQAGSLSSGTRHVHENAEAPQSMFAHNTSEAVAAGVCFSCAALVDRACERIAAAGERDVKLFFTGGEALRVVPLLATPCEVDPDLVLRGIGLLAEQTGA